MIINFIIQCRMSSKRFPGKVLAPFLGKPLFYHVVKQLKKTEAYSSIILATSEEKSDDPLVSYAKELGLKVIRGSLDDVVDRYSLALDAHSCDAFFRVCGDSPLLLPHLFDHALSIYKKKSYDLITNIFPRTYPVGMSVELINTKNFLATKKKIFKKNEKKHITKHFYDNYKNFKIYNIECNSSLNPSIKLAIDDYSDLQNIEKWILKEKYRFDKLFHIKFSK